MVRITVETDSNHSGTLGKERNNKGRKKWGGILSGGKHKHVSRLEDESADSLRALHDSLPKHPLPISIPKEQMVSFSVKSCYSNSNLVKVYRASYL